MKNTTFISAGAGSGKTYTLTQEIAKMITEGKCGAEEIILTTFTETAAKELREKVRSTLYSKGLYEAAMNIDNAAIGTIHSIAYQFVSRYWYLLGISANVSIMDTEGSELCIARSIASLPSEENLELFDTICRSFNLLRSKSSDLDFGFWEKDLKGIIDKTVELCIDKDLLEEAKEESKKLLASIFKWTSMDVNESVVETMLGYAEESLNVSGNQKNKETIEKNIFLLKSNNGNIHLHGVYSLANVIKTDAKTKKSFPHIVDFFEDLHRSLPTSVQVRKLVEEYVETIFDLAVKWKEQHEEFKRKRCLLDYSDLLQKFDDLLGNDKVVADIKSRYKVAFVDEFQDCSPLQVRFFKRLSELMEKSVWVGDIKQAIYGFRGTNTELIKSIIDEANQKDDGNERKELEHCWRSSKTIVDLVNNVFCDKVFNAQIERKLVELKYPERKENDSPAPKERELQHMHFVSGRKEDIPEALAEQIDNLISTGVYDASDIAVLYRNNTDVAKCAAALKDRGIAYNARFDKYDDKDDSEDIISSFINAVVSFAARGDNELSKAIIANHVEDGYSIPKILTDRIKCIEEGGNKEECLADLDIVKRIESLRKCIGNQSVSAAIETLVVELNLADIIKRIDPAAPTYNYCSELESKATAYESLCVELGLSSTLVGFVEYLKQNPVEYPGDEKGVSIMTYHKSKGLQWPCVILCSLHKEPIDKKKTYFGVLTYNTTDKTMLRLVPAFINSFVSGIMDEIENNEFMTKVSKATIDEAKRLMYVGMTRPKEQLILTTYGNGNCDSWLRNIGCDAIDVKSTASVIKWGEMVWKHSSVTYLPPERDEAVEKTEYSVLQQPAERSLFNAKFVSPSKAKTEEQLYAVEQYATFAERISAKATDGRDSTVGNFIHHAMCLWNGGRNIIAKLAEQYGVMVDVEAVAASIGNFWNWMEKTYGKATAMEREMPFSFVNDNGQVVAGEIDLVYRTAKGDILVDYKTYQGCIAHLTDEDSEFFAGKYAAQISLYEEALKRDGSVIRDRLICYLSLGTVIRFK